MNQNQLNDGTTPRSIDQQQACSALERRWIGAEVTVVFRLSIDCHIPATVTKVIEEDRRDFFAGRQSKELRVFCETSAELQASGWASGWRTVGETFPSGWMGRERKPYLTVRSYGDQQNNELTA